MRAALATLLACALLAWWPGAASAAGAPDPPAIATAALAQGDPAPPPAPAFGDTLLRVLERSEAGGPRGLLRADRLQHASLSFTLAASAGLGGRSRAEAFGFTLALGLAKELHDGRSGRFDPVDLAADVLGAALGAWAAARR